MLKQELKRKTIKAADYKSQRLNLLQDIVVNGEDAEAVFKYCFTFKKRLEEQMLATLKSNTSDISLERNYYKAACEFCEILESAARLGKAKKETLQKLVNE